MNRMSCALFVLLLAGTASAHNAGLSTFDVCIATNGIVVSIGFAPADLQSVTSGVPLGAIEPHVCRLKSDGVPLIPLRGGLLADSVAPVPARSPLHSINPIVGGMPAFAPTDVRFEFVFEPMKGRVLRVGCPLFPELPAGHRQYLTIRRQSGEILAEHLLHVHDAEYTLELAPPPAASLPAFIAAGEKRVLTLTERLALLGAVLLWGAAHAMTPGHGKTMVAAFLVGSRSTPLHAMALGLTVTATHTLGVFVLGVLTLFASHRMEPERLYPWLAAASGMLVAIVGVTMLVRRLRVHQPHDHSHPHHHHGFLHPHHHGHAPERTDAMTWRQLLGLGVSGGLLPCPAALVLLLTSVSLQRTTFGLLLVLVFSAGLAGVLMLVGLLVVKGARVLDRWPTFQRLNRVLPIMSAALITLLGIVLCAQAVRRGIGPVTNMPTAISVGPLVRTVHGVLAWHRR